MTFIKRTFAITLLINIIIAASSNAQPFTYNKDQYLLKRLHYQNSSGEKGVTTFIYDKENQLYKAVWELLDSSRYSFNYYKLNNENIVEVYRTFSDKMTSQKKFTYNTQNQIIEEYFWRSDSVEGTAKYAYKNGKLSKLIANKMNGWFTGELHYEYENQTLKQARIFMKGKNVGIVYYKFSNTGNLIEEKWQFGEKWSQTFTYDYVEKVCLNWVSSNPLLVFQCPYIIEKEDYDFNKETGGPSEFVYDKSGKLIEKTFTRSDGLKTKTTFEYDVERKLVKSYRNYSDSTKGIFSYYYN
jgi:YD repeat-containing protein